MQLKANNRFIFSIILCCVFLTYLASAEPRLRTYRQIKDIAVKENGTVRPSNENKNLFEFTFSIDRGKKIITRTKVRRLDEATAHNDATVYNIMQKKVLVGSEAGNGGKVLVAVRQDGEEILELGHRFAFTLRTSPFSQVITGVYERDYTKDQSQRHRHQHQ